MVLFRWFRLNNSVNCHLDLFWLRRRALRSSSSLCDREFGTSFLRSVVGTAAPARLPLPFDGGDRWWLAAPDFFFFFSLSRHVRPRAMIQAFLTFLDFNSWRVSITQSCSSWMKIRLTCNLKVENVLYPIRASSIVSNKSIGKLMSFLSG
jgi:hypothetical protein